MKTILFTDIDDCFIATKKKFLRNERLSIASLDILGNARSYMSDKQKALLELFIRGGTTIIPVTGRSYCTLQRIQVGSLLNSWKIVSHGALIVEPSGDKCQAWLDYLDEEFPLTMWFDKMKKINESVNELIKSQGVEAKSYIVSEGDFACYICVKCTEGVDYQSIFDSILLEAHIDVGSMKIHINGRNMALLPPYAQKRLAVEFLANRLDKYDDHLTFTMGDSLSDIPFMKLADFALIPIKSQIADSLSW
ncbi:HAD family hydrolase [Vibrio hyugaensis]|uniref:HAD family hydrolase n=1 Tax=Vibrio hyugaensis TaxID=1534743 RepID=UPI0005EF31E3|nr:HAD family hydrolase [Vibrio hyugaensis]